MSLEVSGVLPVVIYLGWPEQLSCFLVYSTYRPHLLTRAVKHRACVSTGCPLWPSSATDQGTLSTQRPAALSIFSELTVDEYNAGDHGNDGHRVTRFCLSVCWFAKGRS